MWTTPLREVILTEKLVDGIRRRLFYFFILQLTIINVQRQKIRSTTWRRNTADAQNTLAASQYYCPESGRKVSRPEYIVVINKYSAPSYGCGSQPLMAAIFSSYVRLVNRTSDDGCRSWSKPIHAPVRNHPWRVFKKQFWNAFFNQMNLINWITPSPVSSFPFSIPPVLGFRRRSHKQPTRCPLHERLL